MPDEVGVIEAPAEVTEVTSTDTSSTDQSTSTDTSTSDQIDSGDTPQPGETGHLRGSELYKTVKDKLKAAGLDPKELRSIRNAIHIADKADKLSDGNLDSIEQARSYVSKLADDPEAGHTPEQIIENTLAERAFWREYDSKFEQGDVSLIPQMVEANSESFQKLAPAAFDEYAKVNPEGFSAYVAKSTKGYLDGKQVTLQFAILDTFLPSMPDFPGKERLIAAIQGIYGAFQGLEQMASNPIAPKKVEGQKTEPGGIDQREQHLNEREQAITRRDWNTEAAPKGAQLRDAEMNRIAGAQKVQLTEEDKQQIRSAVREEVDARLAANSRYGQAMRGYLQAGNKAEYVRRAHSEYEKLVPGATQRHTQAVIDAKKTSAVKKTAPTVNGVQSKTSTTTNGTGNLPQWLSGHPKTLNMRIDLSRTTNGMLQRNEAFLVGKPNLFKWKTKTL